MSTNENVIDGEAVETETVEETTSDTAFQELLEEAFSMEPEQFLGMTAKARELTLFVLLKELCGTVNGLEARLNAYETQVNEVLNSPQVQSVVGMFTGNGGGSGMTNMLMGMLK